MQSESEYLGDPMTAWLCHIYVLDLTVVVVKDRRDAVMLAKLHRAGELTPIWIPVPLMRLCAIWCGRERRQLSSNS